MNKELLYIERIVKSYILLIFQHLFEVSEFRGVNNIFRGGISKIMHRIGILNKFLLFCNTSCNQNYVRVDYDGDVSM